MSRCTSVFFRPVDHISSSSSRSHNFYTQVPDGLGTRSSMLAYLRARHLNAQEILGRLERRKPKLLLLLLDCCRSNADGSLWGRSGTLKTRTRGGIETAIRLKGKEGLAIMSGTGETFIGLGCAPGLTSIDGGEQGLGALTKAVSRPVLCFVFFGSRNCPLQLRCGGHVSTTSALSPFRFC